MKQNPACPREFSPLRTYNVIPLDVNCGIIEWCSGTTSLCSYLIGEDKTSGAHKRYRPEGGLRKSKFNVFLDISAVEARNLMHRERLFSREDSKERFLEICEKIGPVFRFFFYEKFRNPSLYHDRILRYTQSLAQWSVVCYVVGLGDRHLNNILLGIFLEFFRKFCI